MAEPFHSETKGTETVVHRITASTLSPFTAALIAWVIVFAIHTGIALSLSRDPSHRFAILFDAGTTALVVAALVWVSLFGIQRLRQQRESETAEVNHNVRNALQLIVNAEYRAQGTTRRSLIMESVARIDSTLRKLFPSSRS